MGRFVRALSLVLLCVTGCDRFHAEAADGDRAQRVVSVSKQINEFLYAIGAEDALVAVDLSSTYPPEIRELPTVGYHRALSAEGVLSVRPTLFLTDGNVGPAAVLDRLREVGLPILELRPGATVESAQRLLRQLGERFHREAAADSVLAVWRHEMDAVLRDTIRWAGQRRPRVLIVHFGRIINNYLAVSRGGAADRMIRWAGGVNAIDSIGGMTRLTPELVALAAPDVVIATDFGYDRYGSAEAFATLPGIALTPAGKNGRIYRIEETEILYFGPRSPATIRKLAEMFHA